MNFRRGVLNDVGAERGVAFLAFIAPRRLAHFQLLEDNAELKQSENAEKGKSETSTDAFAA